MSAMIHKWIKVANYQKAKRKGLGHMEPNPKPRTQINVVISEEGTVSYETEEIEGTWNRYSDVSIQYHRDNPHDWVKRNMNAPAQYQVPQGRRYGPTDYLYTMTEEEIREALSDIGLTESEIEDIVNYQGAPLWFEWLFTGVVGLYVFYRVRGVFGLFRGK